MGQALGFGQLPAAVADKSHHREFDNPTIHSIINGKIGRIRPPTESAGDCRFMKVLTTVGWSIMAASLLAMRSGHFGAGHLSWISDQISTYAAVAPQGYLITASIWLSALGLLVVGAVVTRHPILGGSHLASIAMALSGAASAGLMTLAHYKETARSLTALKHSGFWAIRIQSFHDAGLMIFFYSAILFVMLVGVLMTALHKRVFDRAFGTVVFALAPISYLLMTTRWPKYVGFSGVNTGVNERATLFCLWLAAAIVFALASRSTRAVGTQVDVQGAQGLR